MSQCLRTQFEVRPDFGRGGITQGSRVQVVVNLVDRGTPYQIQGFVGASAVFRQTDSETPLVVTGAVLPVQAGTLGFDILEAYTALLELGQEQSFEVRLEDSNGLRVHLFESQLAVHAPLFP